MTFLNWKRAPSSASRSVPVLPFLRCNLGEKTLVSRSNLNLKSLPASLICVLRPLGEWQRDDELYQDTRQDVEYSVPQKRRRADEQTLYARHPLPAPYTKSAPLLRCPPSLGPYLFSAWWHLFSNTTSFLLLLRKLVIIGAPRRPTCTIYQLLSKHGGRVTDTRTYFQGPLS